MLGGFSVSNQDGAIIPMIIDDSQLKEESKGVWIPRCVWDNENLTLQEKALLVKVESFKECFASNEYLANFINVSVSRVKQVIKSLEEKGFVYRTVERKGTVVAKRVISVNRYLFYGVEPRTGSCPTKEIGQEVVPSKDRKLSEPRTGSCPYNNKDSNNSVNSKDTPITPKGVDERPAPVKLKPKKPDDQERKFNLFWSLYPRKTNKQAAIKAWQKLKPSNDLFDKIMHALSKHCVSDGWQRDGGQFIPHPSTWINGKRWEDELPVNLPQVRNSAPVEPNFHDTTWAQNMDDGL